MINETQLIENFIIKSEHESLNSKNYTNKSSTNNSLSPLNETNYDNDIIWLSTIFDKYNEQKIDQNVFIDLTNDDLNLLLDDTNTNIDLFQTNTNTEESIVSSSSLSIPEVKNEAAAATTLSTFTNEKKCEYCNKVFYKLYNYKRHLLIHNNEYPYSCDYCSHKFKDQSNLKKHLKLCNFSHEAETVTITSTTKTITAQQQQQLNSSKLKIYKYKCDYCEKRFYKKFNLTRHINMHKLNCVKIEAATQIEQINDFDSKNRNYYECKICFKKFNELKQLNLHNQNWHKMLEQKIECNFCKENFDIKYDFFIHKLTCSINSNSAGNGNSITTKGNVVKFYKCNKCKKSFTKLYNLNRHLASRHVIVGNNDEATQQQQQQQQLNEQLIKKYVCKFCSKSFYECNKLKLHLNNCHSVSNHLNSGDDSI